MLAVCFSSLLELLETRDRRLGSLTALEGTEKLFNNRSVYQLAESPIDLLADLTKTVNS